MAIQPIDLQTLFVRLSQVGREQSAIKQSIVQGQAVAGGEIAQRSREADGAVPQSREVNDGPVEVNDQSQRQGADEHPSDTTDHRRSEGGDPSAFTDPELGQNIDVTG